ncbi:MAG: hypothetical protein FWF44_10885, partial [Defluviitaleaceae bacterium]|nr:hypothetical protein [Defluviitaleaceae bacterium]
MRKIVFRGTRNKILTVFSALLFFSFFLVYLVFNIAVARYISGNAATELDSYINTNPIVRIAESQVQTPDSGVTSGGG